MDKIRTGGCTCGRVRYSLRGEPIKAGICHCTSCRKETGSVFSNYVDWPRGAFEMTGEVSTYEGRSFCPGCGSRLFHLSEDTVEIMAGSLDEAPTGLRPQEEIWIKRREHWLTPLEGTGQHREDSPKPVE